MTGSRLALLLLGLAGALAVAGIVVAGFTLSAAAQDAEGGAVLWRTDLEAARAEAREKGRPLLVVFR